MTQTKVLFGSDYTRLALATTLILGLSACSTNSSKDAPPPPIDVHAGADSTMVQPPSAPIIHGDQSTLAEAVASQRGMSSAAVTGSPSPAATGSATQFTVTSAKGTTVKLAEGAPSNYVVKKGDTLWAISGMYLSDPWLWPELWKLNPQIQNPHLIYPGDQVSLTFEGGQAQLSVSRGGEVVATTGTLPAPAAAEREVGPGTIRVTPKIRTTPLDEAVTFLPIDAVRPFLTQTGIVDPETVKTAPYIFSSVDNRVMSGANDRVYVRNIPEGATHFTVVRMGKPYEDPDSGDELGYAAQYIGEAQVEVQGDPGIVRLSSTKLEALPGDKLITDNLSLPTESFQPRPPKVKVQGVIIDVVGGVANIGPLQVVVLNKGTADGLQPGDVLLIMQNKGERHDAADGWMGETIQLPDSRTGELMVFRTFNRVSYALVMHAESEIHTGDTVRNP